MLYMLIQNVEEKKDEDDIKPLSAIIPEMNMIKMSASCLQPLWQS